MAICPSPIVRSLPPSHRTLAAAFSPSNTPFHECSSLSSLTLPEGLTTIGQDAFRDCTSLASVILPEGLATIEGGAFRGCTILEERSGAAGHPSVVSYLRFFCRASRRYAEMCESEREGDQGGAASGAQGDEDGAASGAQGDEEREGGESEEGGGGAGEEREERAGNAEAGGQEGGDEAKRGGRKRKVPNKSGKGRAERRKKAGGQLREKEGAERMVGRTEAETLKNTSL